MICALQYTIHLFLLCANPCGHCAQAHGALMRPWDDLGYCSHSGTRESAVNKISTPNNCGFRRLNLHSYKKNLGKMPLLLISSSSCPLTAGYQTTCKIMNQLNFQGTKKYYNNHIIVFCAHHCWRQTPPPHSPDCL